MKNVYQSVLIAILLMSVAIQGFTQEPLAQYNTPSEIPKFQEFLRGCKLQAPTSSTVASNSNLMEGYASDWFYVAEDDKIAFNQSGESKRTELRHETNWNLTERNRSLHGRLRFVEQTCDQVTVVQIHDDAGAGDGPNKPLLRIYKHLTKSPENHLWAAIKTDAGGVNTTHVDLGLASTDYFSWDVNLEGGRLIININGDEKANLDVSFWTFPSYWKAGVYLQDNGEATVYFDELYAEEGNEITIIGYPSNVISYFDEWKITLGDGSTEKDLIDYKNENYFYSIIDGGDWVVYKTPNSGGTTPNSSNTRSELRHLPEWTPETGGNLTGTLKVMQVSKTGDARVPACFSVVVGQIHSSEGHENEPLKIFYKKFPGQSRGSVFWNYEINTQGDNSERWDYSTAVWGYDWSVVGETATNYPAEPADGIELGEEFSYEINVFDGIMYLTFESEGHETKTFTKSLVSSDYSNYTDIPVQVLAVFSSTGQDGTERTNAYAGELQYFKQGAYNQTNGKEPTDNMIWNTGAETYEGNLEKQYANGSFAEVWFKEAIVGAGIEPENSSVKGHVTKDINIYPNPFSNNIQINSSAHAIVTVRLFNIVGQCLLNKSCDNANLVQLNLGDIEAGSYFLIVEDVSKQRTVRKIFKQ